MKSLIPVSMAAALVTLAAGNVRAADYPQPYQPPPPQPVIIQQPAVVEFGNWYLRGDVGIGILQNTKLQYLQNPLNSSDFVIDSTTMSDTYFIGMGVGYEFNNWLRFDVTGEYRAKASFNAIGHYTDGAGGVFLDVYHGYLKSMVFLANGYIDIGTWNCFTPFVGVGVGGAYNTIDGLTDVGIPTAGSGFGRNTSQWNLAWALHAGVAYNVTKSFKVELAYRFLNLGSATDTIDCVGGCFPDSYKFNNLYSHDIKLGLRWTCCETERYVERTTYVPPPMYEQPPPVYTPPPTYSPPPPLRSRG
jgi:opacity protein-like surface antigen